MISNGMVQVFTGEGRGKTSAALGTAMRAVGYGLKVFVVFFMKGSHEGGEYTSLEKLGVDFKVTGRSDFYGPADISAKDRNLAQHALISAGEIIGSRKYDLVVLDEINTAAAWNLIDVNDVVRLIDIRPPSTELILTGRHADRAILDRAGYVTELANLKHPFDRGLPAREGIDY